MKKKTFVQNIVATVPNATAADSISSQVIQLNPDYPYIKEVAVNVVNDGGDANFRIGLNHGSQVVEEPHHNANWTTDSVAHRDKWKSMGALRHVGNDIRIITENQAELTSELQYEITFVLTDEPC